MHKKILQVLMFQKKRYLKHHTTAAFPAAVLLRAKPETIRYTIMSKNSVEGIDGNLLVE